MTGRERDHAVFISTGGEEESIHKSIFETITMGGGGGGEPANPVTYISIYIHTQNSVSEPLKMH
mgnify:CR=1 FL=1